MVNILKEMLKAHFSFELKLKTLKMHQLHLNETCFFVTVSPDAFIHKYDIWLKMLLHTQYYFSNKYKVLYENILQLEEEKFIKYFYAYLFDAKHK